MTWQLQKIENIKTGTTIDVPNGTAVDANNDQYTIKNVTDALGSTESKDLQFTLKGDDDKKVIVSNGKIDKTAKTVSELKPVRETHLQFKGTLDIKPPGKPSSVAKLNVSIGNWNSRGHWIINMSERVNGTPSTLNVSGLMNWINNNGGNSTLALPSAEGGAKPEDKQLDALNNFTIEFNALYFNITNGDYDIDLQTQEASTLTIMDKFTLSNIKFRMTNMDISIQD